MSRKFDKTELTNDELDVVEQLELKKKQGNTNKQVRNSIGTKDSLTPFGDDLLRVIAHAYRIDVDNLDIEITDKYIKLTDESNPHSKRDESGEIVGGEVYSEEDKVFINYKDDNIADFLVGFIKFGEYTNRLMEQEAENHFEGVSLEDLNRAYGDKFIPKLHINSYQNRHNIYSNKVKQTASKIERLGKSWKYNYWTLDVTVTRPDGTTFTVRDRMKEKYGDKLAEEGTAEFNFQLQATLKEVDDVGTISDELYMEDFYDYVDEVGQGRPFNSYTNEEIQEMYDNYMGYGAVDEDYTDEQLESRLRDLSTRINSYTEDYKHIRGRRPNSYKSLQELNRKLIEEGNTTMEDLRSRTNEYNTNINKDIEDITARIRRLKK